MHGHANAKHKHKHTNTRSPSLLWLDQFICVGGMCLREYIQSLGLHRFLEIKARSIWKFWSVGPMEDWRVLANVSASSSFKADVDQHPSIPSIRPTSPAIAPPAFRAQSPPIWWVFVPEIRIHNHLDLSHFVSLEIRLSYLTHSRRRSRLGRKEFLNTFLNQAFETKTFWMKTVCSLTIPRVLSPPLHPGCFCYPK